LTKTFSKETPHTESQRAQRNDSRQLTIGIRHKGKEDLAIPAKLTFGQGFSQINTEGKSK
jgi:hypothetical protein